MRYPPRVCILAPGLNGKPHYADIPDDCCVIALNKAVLIPEVKVDVWLMNLADQDWFEEVNAAFDGVRVFWRELKESVDYDLEVEKRLLAIDNTDCYYFRVLRPGLQHIRTGTSIEQLIDLHILAGATVTGAALQLAYHFGVREVLLCGADMSGDAYACACAATPQGPRRSGETSRKRTERVCQRTCVKGFFLTISPSRFVIP